MKRPIFPKQPGCGAESHDHQIQPPGNWYAGVNGNVPSGPPMNSSRSQRVEALNPRNDLLADQTRPAEQLEDDFALVQLDTTFAALLTEISALEAQHGDGRGRRDENLQSDEASRTQQIESVLARLEPVERAIMATPARTIVGLGVKARHVAYVLSEHWDRLSKR